ncbi:MAG TPA: VTT domain-containing protein, partial [Mariniflexile sp.]
MAKVSKATLFTIATFAIGFLIPALGFLFPETFFSNRQQISSFIQSFGLWTPIIFITISIIPVVFTPLNHGVFGIVGGFIFGPWLGFLLNWIAKIIGTTINFFIGQTLGKKAIRHFTKTEDVKQYNMIFDRHKFLLFIGFSVNDTLSYLAGISNMELKTFLPLTFLAQIMPALILAYIGSGISLSDPLFIALSFTVVLFATIYFYLK